MTGVKAGMTTVPGVFGLGGGTEGLGVLGQGSGTGSGVAGVGGPGGIGVEGSAAGSGTGVSGRGGPVSGTGIYGRGGDPNGTGILGEGRGPSPGVHGSSLSPSGFGVLGDSASGVGMKGTSGAGVGVLAEATGAGKALAGERTRGVLAQRHRGVRLGGEVGAVPLPGLTAASLVIATVQNAGKVWVASAVPDVGLQQFTINLKAAPKAPATATVAWFVVN